MTRRLENGVFFGRPRLRLALDGLRVTESRYREGTDIPAHSHATAHFCFVLEGSYVERLGTKPHDRAPESLVWHPSGASHSERHRTGGRHLLVEIDPDRLAALDLPPGGVDAPREIAGTEASWLIHRIERETRDPDAASALAVEGAVLGLVAEVVRDRGPRERHEPRWMSRVDEYLRARLAGTPALAEVAAVAGVHPSHLSRTWRRLRRCTLGEEHRRMRVERACLLLSRAEPPIAVIALECGFVDQSHFSRVFKRQVGLPPGEFRRKVAGGRAGSPGTRRATSVQDDDPLGA